MFQFYEQEGVIYPIFNGDAQALASDRHECAECRQPITDPALAIVKFRESDMPGARGYIVHKGQCDRVSELTIGGTDMDHELLTVSEQAKANNALPLDQRPWVK